MLGSFAVSMPNAAADPMTMLKVFDPTRASLELILGNPERFGDIPSFVPDQRIRKCDILRDRSDGQPINELTLDLWELGRSMLRNLELFLGWNVHPLLFVLQDFTDRAPFDAVFDRNVFLSSGGVLLVIQADLLTVDVEKALLFVFSGGWRGIDLGRRLGWAGGGRNGGEGRRHAQGWRGGSGVRI